MIYKSIINIASFVLNVSLTKVFNVDCIFKNGHKQKRTTDSTSDDETITTSSAETVYDVMEGNDLSFLSASPDPLRATSHLLPTSSSFQSATPKYSLIDASGPSKEQSQSSSYIEGNVCISFIFKP